MEDITLACVEKDCGKSFVYRVKDQLFFQEQGYTPPKRCTDCRARKKANQPKVVDGNKFQERTLQPRFTPPAQPIQPTQPAMTMHEWTEPAVPRRRQNKDRDRRY